MVAEALHCQVVDVPPATIRVEDLAVAQLVRAVVVGHASVEVDLPVRGRPVERLVGVEVGEITGGFAVQVEIEVGTEDPEVPGVVGCRGLASRHCGKGGRHPQRRPDGCDCSEPGEAQGKDSRQGAPPPVVGFGRLGIPSQGVCLAVPLALADEPDRELRAATAGPLSGDQHMDVSVVLVTNVVYPRQLGAEELLVAAAGAAVQEDAQGPIERLNRRRALPGRAAWRQHHAEDDCQNRCAQRHYLTLPSSSS